MDRINLHSPRVLGLLQPKREMLEKPSELSRDGVAVVSQLQTPKRGETVSQHSVKAFSAFTPTHDTHQSTMTSTPVTSLFKWCRVLKVSNVNKSQLNIIKHGN